MAKRALESEGLKVNADETETVGCAKTAELKITDRNVKAKAGGELEVCYG